MLEVLVLVLGVSVLDVLAVGKLRLLVLVLVILEELGT